MPSADKTKIQKRREGTNAKARHYYQKKRRAKVGNKKWWLDAFIGKRDMKELQECYGIIP